MKPWSRILPTLALTARLCSVLSCGGGGSSQGGSVAPTPSILLSLSTQIIKTNEVQALSVNDSTVANSNYVLSATAGTVTLGTNGYLYTAPAAPGTYFIKAQLKDNPAVTTSLTVYVVEVSIEVVGHLPHGPGELNEFSTDLLPDGRILIRSFPYEPVIWDPVTRGLSTISITPVDSSYPDTVVLRNGEIICIAGQNVGGPLGNYPILGFNTTSNAWNKVGSLNYFRYMETATELTDGRVLIVGGEGGAANQNWTIELWDPVTGGTARYIGDLITPRSRHTTTLLTNGSLLITGGNFAYAALRSTELIASDLKTIKAGPPMANSRTYHNATTLTDGRVLVAGGGTDVSLEIFDPGKETFETVGFVDGGMGNPAVAALPGGRAVLAGGANGGNLIKIDPVSLWIPELKKVRLVGNLPNPLNGAKAIVGRDGVVYLFGGVDATSAARTEIIALTVR